MNLEALLRDAAARGELTHLSLVSSNGLFAACYCPATGFTHSTARHADPVAALVEALQTKPPRARRCSPSKSGDDMDFG